MARSFSTTGTTIVDTAADIPTASAAYEGVMVFQKDANQLKICDGASWIEVNNLNNAGGLSSAGLGQTVRVFTNEAARDAAITAPTEGMVAFLTASTETTATGQETAIPTGIVTIHNGTTWRTMTPGGAQSFETGTTTSLSFTGVLSGSAITPSVQLRTGAGAIVSFSGFMSVSGGNTAVLNFAVSNATTRSSVEQESLYTTSAANAGFGRTVVIGNLTPGLNNFYLTYRTSGGTATFASRHIAVTPIQ